MNEGRHGRTSFIIRWNLNRPCPPNVHGEGLSSETSKEAPAIEHLLSRVPRQDVFCVGYIFGKAHPIVGRRNQHGDAIGVAACSCLDGAPARAG